MSEKKKVKKRKKKDTRQYGRGSGRIRRNYEFEEAREIIHKECIDSVRDYEIWWKLNTPAKFPKRPDRAYGKDFTSWNDFLGNNNPYPSRKYFRSYEDARTFAHKLNLKNKAQWFDWLREAKITGDKPEDIPGRPDIKYQKTGEWFTWAAFLGYDIIDKLKVSKEISTLFFILRYPNVPQNVYKFGITTGGMSTILDQQKLENFTIIKVLDCADFFDWESVVSRTCSTYDNTDISNQYIVPNFYELMDDLMQTNKLNVINR